MACLRFSEQGFDLTGNFALAFPSASIAGESVVRSSRFIQQPVAGYDSDPSNAAPQQPWVHKDEVSPSVPKRSREQRSKPLLVDDVWDYTYIVHTIYYTFFLHKYLYIILPVSTAQGGGGSFKNPKPIGEIGCCESRISERIHWWTDRWLELCFLEWLQWLQWSPYHNCWM